MGLARLAVIAFIAMLTLPAAAQEWPAREMRVFSGFPAGSGADTMARFFSEKLRPYLKQPVLVENKAGALGSLAGEAVARGRPDGYTMLIAGYPAMSVNVHLLKKHPYDPLKEMAAVAPLFWQPFILVVDPKQPIHSVSDLTAHLKRRGDKASYGVTASSSVVLGELYKTYAGVDALQVTYRAAANATNDMLDGQIDFTFSDPVFAMEQVRAGRLRALAVSTPKRSAAAPEIQTMTEAGVPGATFTSWWGAVMPAGTPNDVILRLNAWFNEILATDETKRFLASFGADPLPGTPEDLRKLQVDEIERWKDYVRIAKIEPQ